MGLFDSLKKGLSDLLGKAKDEAADAAKDAVRDKANDAVDSVRLQIFDWRVESISLLAVGYKTGSFTFMVRLKFCKFCNDGGINVLILFFLTGCKDGEEDKKAAGFRTPFSGPLLHR